MRIFNIAILASLLSVSFNSFADLNNGLIAYWSFDDCTANDQSGKENNGITDNAQNCVAGISGIDKALTFNGINDVISIQNSPSLNNITNKLSIATWIKFNDIHTSSYGFDWQSIVNKSNFGASYGLMLAHSFTPKILRFYHNGASLDITDYNWSDVKENQWYLITTTYDGTNAKIYIDGKLVSTNPVTGNINANTENIYIGENVSSNWYGYFLNADMSSTRIYNRPLTAAEVTTLYQQSANTPTNLLPEGNIGKAWVTLGRFGKIIDSYMGVNAQMNDLAGFSIYQCTQLVDRFARNVFHLANPNMPDGNQLAQANDAMTGYIDNNGTQTKIITKYYPSGSKTPPINGSIISQNSSSSHGHVSIAKKVVTVNEKTLDIYLFEQNWIWVNGDKIAHSRKIRFTKNAKGGWKSKGSSSDAIDNSIIGWLNPKITK